MKINYNTQINGTRVILIPYEEKHVQKYHKWLMCPQLQHWTASEPLTLEEEYKMQKSWRNDEDKCTFIILDAEIYANTTDEIESMIGDTNLYFNDADDEHAAECVLMIAEKTARDLGLGWEAMCLMFRYGMEVLKVSKYIAKIKKDNESSIKMFEKFKFKEESRSEVFGEITFSRIIDEEWRSWLIIETSGKYFPGQYSR